MKNVALLIVFLVLLLSACTDTQQKLPDAATATDSTIKWFGQAQHYKDSNYKAKFTAYYDSLLKKNAVEPASELLAEYGFALDLLMLPDSAFLYTAIPFYQQNAAAISNRSKVALRYLIGSQYNLLSRPDSSNYWLLQAMVHSDDTLTNQYAGFAGIVLYDNVVKTGDLDSALRIALNNVSRFEKVHDTANLSTALSIIYDLYTRMRAYPEANAYQNLSLQFALAAKDTSFIITSYLNKAKACMQLKQDDSAFYFAQKCNEIRKHWSQNNDFENGHTYWLLATVYLNRKQPDSSRYYLQLSDKSSSTFPALKAKIELTAASIDKEERRPVQNISKIISNYEQYKAQNNYIYAITNAEVMVYHFTQTGDYQKAYRYQDTLYQMRDSLWNDDKRRAILELEKKYKSEIKEKQIAVQETTIVRNKFLISILSLTILSILLAGVTLLGFRRRQQAKNEMHKQEEFTRQLFENTEEERSRIANELHDSVNHNLLVIKNKALMGKTIEGNDIANIIDEVRSISRNLHPAMFTNIGLTASIESLCERLTNEQGLFTTCDIEYNNTLSKQSELQLYRIVQEALSNTLKHGKANAAKIILSDKSQHLYLEIKDNGTGFDVNNQFNNNKSFGLQSIFQRAKAIAAKLNIDSSAKGTSIVIIIPV